MNSITISKQGVWDMLFVCKYDEVVAEVKRRGRTIHLGDVFGICVEKGSEFEAKDLATNGKADTSSEATT
eukprot:15969097-Heterocapsa_arctica.AAC.1